jgi:hypothetical protein
MASWANWRWGRSPQLESFRRWWDYAVLAIQAVEQRAQWIYLGRYEALAASAYVELAPFGSEKDQEVDRIGTPPLAFVAGPSAAQLSPKPTATQLWSDSSGLETGPCTFAP